MKTYYVNSEMVGDEVEMYGGVERFVEILQRRVGDAVEIIAGPTPPRVQECEEVDAEWSAALAEFASKKNVEKSQKTLDDRARWCIMAYVRRGGRAGERDERRGKCSRT